MLAAVLHTILCFRTTKTRNNRKNVEEYFSVVLGGRWFVFLVEPCAAGKDVRLLVWKRLVSSFYVRLAGRANKCTEGGGVTELHHMQDSERQ